MLRLIWTSVRMLVVATLVLGVGYPLVVGGVAAVGFGHTASGSLVTDKSGAVVGSELIGQEWTSPKYFHGRPSAAGKGYDAMASGGSNLGPTSRSLAQEIALRVRAAENDDPALRGKVPADMVTASGSGLDPDISPDTAYAQVMRVAAARGMSEAAVRALVASHIAGRELWLLGEPRVNVLALNMALDSASAVR